MKIGLSTYSLRGAYVDGRLDMPGIVRTIAEWGGEHVEVVPLADFLENPELPKLVKAEAEKCGIPLSSYTFGANFLLSRTEDAHELSDAERRAEIERVKKHIDIAAELGVKLVRHDVGHRPVEQTGTVQFERDLPVVADACREVADYAAQYGICTNIEHHGRIFQGSEHVHRLVDLVARPNFRCVIDFTNFWSVDEDPYSGTVNNLDIASMIHFKDHYRRTSVPDPKNWMVSEHGYYLHGAIVGYGDVDLPRIVGLLKTSGFAGPVSLEYASNEIDSLFGAKRSWECVSALFA